MANAKDLGKHGKSFMMQKIIEFSWDSHPSLRGVYDAVLSQKTMSPMMVRQTLANVLRRILKGIFGDKGWTITHIDFSEESIRVSVLLNVIGVYADWFIERLMDFYRRASLNRNVELLIDEYNIFAETLEELTKYRGAKSIEGFKKHILTQIQKISEELMNKLIHEVYSEIDAWQPNIKLMLEEMNAKVVKRSHYIIHSVDPDRFVVQCPMFNNVTTQMCATCPYALNRETLARDMFVICGYDYLIKYFEA